MKTNGFYITEIRLTGKNKEDAKIILKKGLNVISGASDTGKTYIFQLINYMFGSEDEPKAIDESIGYSTIYLEIKAYSGKEITLKREIGESTIHAYESKIDEIHVLQNYEKLKAKHDKDDKDNISSFLLSLTGIEGMLLRKNARGNKISFSFRHFAGLIMLNEEKIITERIPIFSGIPTNKTAEQSAFKTVLTGVDDSEGVELEDPKIYKTRLEGKLEFVNASLKKLKEEINDKREQVEGYKADDLSNEIDKLMGVLSDNSKEINLRMEQKNRLWNQEQEIKTRILMLEELQERFKLLEKSYLSDLDRLQFLIEGDHFISQLYDSNCPICDNPITLDKVEHDHKFHLENLQIACREESHKLDAQLSDLRATLNTLQMEYNEKDQEVKFLKQQIGEIETFIIEELKPVAVLTKEHLERLLHVRQIFQEIEMNERRIADYQAKQLEIMRELSKKNQRAKFVNEITKEIYNDLADEIKKLLKGWNYPDLTSVTFDYDDQELIVSGKMRKNHGKGYRAILNTAFLIAIMKYTRNNGLKHPGIIILDSPLTTYKEKTTASDSIGSEEDISLDMKQAFFNNLSDINQAYPDVQIIIFENIEPMSEVQGKMNYIHFTKTVGVGRYGFIPVD